MSFLRHEQIYRSDGATDKAGYGEEAASRTHRFDESAAGYSLAGCAPAEPASASPAVDEYATQRWQSQPFSSERQPVPYLLASPNDRTATHALQRPSSSFSTSTGTMNVRFSGDFPIQSPLTQASVLTTPRLEPAGSRGVSRKVVAPTFHRRSQISKLKLSRFPTVPPRFPRSPPFLAGGRFLME